jgi:hypothetical protein
MLYTPGPVLWQRGDVGRIKSRGAVWVCAHAQLTTIATASVCDTPRVATACPAHDRGGHAVHRAAIAPFLRQFRWRRRRGTREQSLA